MCAKLKEHENTMICGHLVVKSVKIMLYHS
uniref:Uncharacterized protein n=1 Tax=Rhizophora mucronata TaxID=61149 RepID=A0A2P2LHI1_RHIMU